MIPSLGLIQGHPLSPYLGMVCYIGFELQSRHQVFTIFYLRMIAFSSHGLLLRTVGSSVDVYSQSSSQAINFHKSSVESANVALPLQDQLASFLGVQRVERHDRYLGLPTFVAKNKKQTFLFIKERVTKRLNGVEG